MKARAPFAAAAALSLLGAACGGSDGGGAALGRGPATTTTSSTVLVGQGAVVTRSGVVVPVISRAGNGWVVSTPCGRPAEITDGTPTPAAAVVLDPGHGGKDPGAVSPSGLQEEPVNLAVARYAKGALEAAGVSALLTRTGDYDMDLQPRADIARAVRAQAFVSIHHNADPDGPSLRPGTETYYQIGSTRSKRLSGLIYEEVVAALSRYPVAWVGDRDAGAKYRQGARGDYYAVLRLPGQIVSALAELAFITNPPEAELVARADVQQVEGEAVARGVLRYLRTEDPGSGFTEPYPRPSPPDRPPGSPPPPCTDPPL